ncbi:MAG: T9SS type A sorting domain-containing protein, partial [Bacteroidota bacterium]
VLTFTFDDIQLPDSSVNMLASNGFIQFTISPKAGLPLPTLLENRAGIYFDFNEPILTNTVWHTIDNDHILFTNLDVQPLAPANSVYAFPNPSQNDYVNLIINTKRPGPYQVELFDPVGRTVMTRKSGYTTFSLLIDGLLSGWYIAVVTNDEGKYLGQTRVFVK